MPRQHNISLLFVNIVEISIVTKKKYAAVFCRIAGADEVDPFHISPL
jgi:hypothetical protein